MTGDIRAQSKAAARLAVKALSLIHSKLEDSGMTQKELAQRMDLSEGRISQILNGDGNLHLASLARVLRALGYTVDLETRRVSEERQDETRYNNEPVRGYSWSTTVPAFSRHGDGVVEAVISLYSEAAPQHHLSRDYSGRPSVREFATTTKTMISQRAGR